MYRSLPVFFIIYFQFEFHWKCMIEEVTVVLCSVSRSDLYYKIKFSLALTRSAFFFFFNYKKIWSSTFRRNYHLIFIYLTALIKQKQISSTVFWSWILFLVLPRFNCIAICILKPSAVNAHQNSLALNFQLDTCINPITFTAFYSMNVILVKELAVVPHYYQFLCNNIYYCILWQLITRSC